MAYQFGVLVIIVVGSTLLISIVIVAIMRRDIGIVAGTLAAIGLVYWYSDLRTPDGFWRRIHLLLRDGVPLAPYGFRRNATLGYWLGIPIIYFGHVITAGTLYVASELLRRPTEGIPLGIAIGFALLAYSAGIGLVESSYQLWAKRLDGVIPGDAGSSPLRPVVYSIAGLTIVVVGFYSSVYSPPSGERNPPNVVQGPAPDEHEPIAIARVALADFLAVTYPGWAGEAIYRYDVANIVKRIPATLVATIPGGQTVNLRIDLEGSSTELQLKLGESGEQLNGLAIIERSELPGGMLRIVAYGDSEDASQETFVRVVILVSDDKFVLKKYVGQEGRNLLLRDDFWFERAANTSR